MTAAAHVLGLVRAHYNGDETAFASAATLLARGAKQPQVRHQISQLIQIGRRQPPRPGQSFQPLRPPEPKANGMLQPITPMSFAELVLEPEIQAQLDELAIELEYREALADRKVRARNRLLFHGPPGNGKTSCAGALANALGLRAYCVNLSRTVSKYLGETGQNLGQLFDSITATTFVVLDEIDAIAAHRGVVDQAAGKEFNSTVNTLLTLMDRNRTGIIVATTNRPDIIDPALLRRFDERLYFPAPSVEQMRGLASKLAEDYGIKPPEVVDCGNFDEVHKRTETHARRSIMQEILAAEAENEDEDGDEEEGN